MKAHVWVMLKNTVLDPQGQTIQHALASLGYAKVQDVRQGKFFVLQLDGLSKQGSREANREDLPRGPNQPSNRGIPLRNRRKVAPASPPASDDWSVRYRRRSRVEPPPTTSAGFLRPAPRKITNINGARARQMPAETPALLSTMEIALNPHGLGRHLMC